MHTAYQTVLFDTSGDSGIDLFTIDQQFDWSILACVEERYEEARWAFNKLQERRREKEDERGHPCPLSVLVLTAMNVALFREGIEGEGVDDDGGADADEGVGDAVGPCGASAATDVFRRSGAGRPGFPFLPMLKAFLMAPYLGIEQNAELIAEMLRLNLQYQMVCGFPGRLPDARALRRFRQIMYTYDLWGDVKRLIVLRNIELGVYELPRQIAVDPTHLDAFASVNKETKTCKECPKRDRCRDHQTTCDVTGIVSKSNNFKLPGVKGTMIGLPDSEILIDAIAGEGNAHDSRLLDDSLRKLARNYPLLKDRVDKILADRAYDCQRNREEAREHLDADLVTPINERNRKDLAVDVQGIKKIDKQGRPHCIAGHIMALAGRDTTREQYIWRCPVFAERYAREGLSCPPECKALCAPEAREGRVYRVPRSLTPQINWDVPQHLASTELVYDMRTSIERVIGRGKRGFNFERFFGRGERALQGHMDRWVIAVNLLAFVAWTIGKEKLTRAYRLNKVG